MSDSAVLLSRQGATAVVRYHHPPQQLIDLRRATRLCDALLALLADDSVRAVVLTGAQPGHFIRHADVAQIHSVANALGAQRLNANELRDSAFHALCTALEQARKPVIAAIDGICMGGGFEIALCCTARIAGPGATHIGLPEIRLGIFPGAGGARRLAQLIGRHRARRFTLDGRVVDAQAALTLGLVDDYCHDPLGRALQLAERIATRPACAVAAVMTLLRPDQAQAQPTSDAEALALGELLQQHADARALLHNVARHGIPIETLD